MEIPPLILVHLVAALGSLLLGALVLLRPKGTRLHRALGGGWVALMLLCTLSSFGIRQVDGSFGFLHGLSAFTLCSLLWGLWCIRRGNRRGHRQAMIGAYLGLAGAGLGAFVPGRLLHSLLHSLLEALF